VIKNLRKNLLLGKCVDESEDEKDGNGIFFHGILFF
jgi:hypothetical protein